MTKENMMASLRKKLNPKRFAGMSGKMSAIVDYVLGNTGGKRHTVDEIIEMTISASTNRTTGGLVLARVKHYTPDGTHTHTDIGYDEVIGAEMDLWRNWRNLLDVTPDLLPEEKELAIRLLRQKILRHR